MDQDHDRIFLGNEQRKTYRGIDVALLQPVNFTATALLLLSWRSLVATTTAVALCLCISGTGYAAHRNRPKCCSSDTYVVSRYDTC